eukprot:RCo044804
MDGRDSSLPTTDAHELNHALRNGRMQKTLQQEFPFYSLIANTGASTKKQKCTQTTRGPAQALEMLMHSPHPPPPQAVALHPSLDAVGQGGSRRGGVHVGHGCGARSAGVAGQRTRGLREEASRCGRAHRQGRADGILLQAAPHEDPQDQRHGDHQQGQQGKQRGVAARHGADGGGAAVALAVVVAVGQRIVRCGHRAKPNVGDTSEQDEQGTTRLGGCDDRLQRGGNQGGVASQHGEGHRDGTAGPGNDADGIGGDPSGLVDCRLEHGRGVGGAVLVKLNGCLLAALGQGADDGKEQVAIRGAVDGDASGAHRADVVAHNGSVRIGGAVGRREDVDPGERGARPHGQHQGIDHGGCGDRHERAGEDGLEGGARVHDQGPSGGPGVAAVGGLDVLEGQPAPGVNGDAVGGGDIGGGVEVGDGGVGEAPAAQLDDQGLVGGGVADHPGVGHGYCVAAHREGVDRGNARHRGVEPGGDGRGRAGGPLGLEGEHHVAGCLRLGGVPTEVVHHKRNHCRRQQNLGRGPPGA